MTPIFRLHDSPDGSSAVTLLRSVAPIEWFSGAAEVIVACLFVTCTFVTVAQPVFDNGACQLMLPLFAGAALVLEALCIVRDVRGVPSPREWSRSLTIVTCSFVALLVWAAVSIPFHEHLIYDDSMGVTRDLPLYALVMPLAEAMVTLLVAIFACRMIAVGNLLQANDVGSLETDQIEHPAPLPAKQNVMGHNPNVGVDGRRGSRNLLDVDAGKRVHTGFDRSARVRRFGTHGSFAKLMGGPKTRPFVKAT